MRFVKIFLILGVLILLSLRFSGFHGNSTQQIRLKNQLEPFSLSRRIKWKCINAFKSVFTHAKCACYSASLDIKYKTLVFMDTIYFIYTLGTDKKIQTTPPALPINKATQNKTYSELLVQLSPYERRVANRYLIQWQDNSTRFSNYFSKKTKSQAEEWEALVASWNTPLQVPEHEQPYHCQQHKQDQKLSSLHLEHSWKMMVRDVENLYWKHYYQNLNFQFRDWISAKLFPHENHTAFHQIQLLLQAQRNESLYYTRVFMLAKLHNTKKSVDTQLHTAYHALNESIYMERGLYYDTLHPDKNYTINIKRTEYKSTSRKMKEIWIDWPQAYLKHTELQSCSRRFQAILQQIWDVCLYLIKKWREMRRAQMRRLLHRFHSVQPRLEGIRAYLFE